MNYTNFIIRDNLAQAYSDVYTPEVLSALAFMVPFNKEIKQAMDARIKRRSDRQKNSSYINFLDPESTIPGTTIKVQDARDGKFEGAVIPADLQRQWIQGTGPATKPNAPLESSIRNVAYALLSGADGWMFDGEDALGQIDAMSLDNQRNLKLAIHKDPLFMNVAQNLSNEINKWAKDFLGRETIGDWRKQLGFTTKISRARGLHLDDRQVRRAGKIFVVNPSCF